MSSSSQGRAATRRPSLRLAAKVRAQSDRSTHDRNDNRVPSDRERGPFSLGQATRQIFTSHLACTWSELNGRPWLEVRNFLLDELLRRCPGFSTREYRQALNTCLSSQPLKWRRFT